MHDRNSFLVIESDCDVWYIQIMVPPFISGEQIINIGNTYGWTFRENFFGTTLFWCSFQSKEKHATFEVFWPESESWLADHCTASNCIWKAKDKGFYLFNGYNKKFEFIHPWES